MKAKPAPRTGEGQPCLEPEHGNALILTGGREWCPHQSHDMPDATSAWLDKQVIPDDQPAAAS